MEQQTSSQTNAARFIKTVHGIRYQVTDVARAVVVSATTVARTRTRRGRFITQVRPMCYRISTIVSDNERRA